MTGGQLPLSFVAMVYAMSSSMAYINAYPSRTADTLQINAMPLILSALCLLALLHGYEVRGLLATLVVDSFCALRDADVDQEKYSLV